MKVKELIKNLEAFDSDQEVVVSILGTNVQPFPHYEKAEITEVVPLYNQNEILMMDLKPKEDITLYGFHDNDICICTKATIL